MVGSECGTILELVESDKSCIFARSKRWCNSCGGISAEKSFYHLIARSPMSSDQLAGSSKVVKLNRFGNAGVCMRRCSI
jgi:hypothetical protein